MFKKKRKKKGGGATSKKKFPRKGATYGPDHTYLCK